MENPFIVPKKYLDEVCDRCGKKTLEDKGEYIQCDCGHMVRLTTEKPVSSPKTSD